MSEHTIKRGLDIPLAGAPVGSLEEARRPRRVALVASDYPGLRPTFFAKVGDTVQRGQALFEDRKNPGVLYTAPAAGVIAAINRGERRALQSIVIDVDERDTGAAEDGMQVPFGAYQARDLDLVDGASARALLIESGLWSAFRTRPFSKIPTVSSSPHSIFVTAMDTNPLAPPMAVILLDRQADLSVGLKVLAKLTPGRIYVCKGDEAMQVPQGSRVTVETFRGPHPSGLPGTHIHTLDPVSRKKTVWYLGLQDLLAIGRVFRTGHLDVSRIISFGGPGVIRPRLLRTRLGTSLDELSSGELHEGEPRVISGSVLAGRTAMGEVCGYLGRYHQQVSVLLEGREREFLGWLTPGGDKFSVLTLFTGRFLPNKRFAMTTSTNGSRRAMVPVGTYERVMPLDIPPTHLLRSLIVNDIERAEQLGALELDEEDLALCTFVCPGKYEYGPLLRRNLTIIEKEG